MIQIQGQLKKALLNRVLGRIERFWAAPWLNVIKTLYVNLRCLPFLQAIKLPIYVYGNVKLHSLNGKVLFECPITRGLVKIGYPGFGIAINCTRTNFKNMGTIIFKGEAQLCNGVTIYVMDGVLKFGNHSILGENVRVACENYIDIGDGSRIAHESQIIDSNFHFIMDVSQKRIVSQKGEIIIGKWCWVGNRTTIQKATVLPDYSIVTSNSLLNKDYSEFPKYAIYGGMPAKFIKAGSRRVFNVETEIILKKYFSVKENREYIYEGNIVDEFFEY